MLEEPVSWWHIDVAHPLKTKKGTRNVVIVRFNNRTIRDTIYDNKRFLKNHNSNVSITEHLTDANLELLDGARDLLGFRNVWTRSCRVFGIVGRKKIPIVSLDSLKDTMSDADTNPDNYIDADRNDGAPRTRFERFTAPTQQQVDYHPSSNYNNNFPPGPVNAAGNYGSTFAPSPSEFFNNSVNNNGHNSNRGRGGRHSQRGRGG